MGKQVKRKSLPKDPAIQKPAKVRRVGSRVSTGGPPGGAKRSTRQVSAAESTAVTALTSSISSLGSDSASTLTALSSGDESDLNNEHIATEGQSKYDNAKALNIETATARDQQDVEEVEQVAHTDKSSQNQDIPTQCVERSGAVAPKSDKGDNAKAQTTAGVQKEVREAEQIANTEKYSQSQDTPAHRGEGSGSVAPKCDVTIAQPGKKTLVIDRAKLETLQYVRIDGYGTSTAGIQYGALHRCLDKDAYTRVMNYALSPGCHPDLVNLAACDPGLFNWGDKVYVTDLDNNIIRFFLVGLSAASTQLFAAQHSKRYNSSGRAGIQLLPAVAVGRRAMAAIAAFGGWSAVRTYTRDSALNLSSLSEGRDSRIAIATESDSFAPESTAAQPTWHENVLKAFTDVPVYDGRNQDFDLTKFQKLPRWKRDLPKGSVVCSIFTLRKWGNPVTVSFNIMAVIWLAESMGTGVSCEAWEELPYHKITG